MLAGLVERSDTWRSRRSGSLDRRVAGLDLCGAQTMLAGTGRASRRDVRCNEATNGVGRA
jgi:hypothetical protein